MPSMPDIEVQPTSCQELTYKLNFTHPIWSITFTDWTHHFENHTFIVFKRSLTWTLPSQCLFRHLCKMSILTSEKHQFAWIGGEGRAELNNVQMKSFFLGKNFHAQSFRSSYHACMKGNHAMKMISWSSTALPALEHNAMLWNMMPRQKQKFVQILTINLNLKPNFFFSCWI